MDSRSRPAVPVLRWRGTAALCVSLLATGFACRGSSSRQKTEQTSRPLSLSIPSSGSSGARPPAWIEADDGQWTRPARDLASTRYSALDQINTANVARLRVAFTFSTGLAKGHEAAPLVVGDTMYVVTPYPNILYALDLARPGAPLKWAYRPEVHAAAQGVACCDVVNQGASYADGKIVYNTLDNQSIAVDAKTGEEKWKTQLADIHHGESMTMAPLVVKDHVLVGNSGAFFGVRGRLTALKVSNGNIAWRAYSTGPDKDVLIGSSFRPFYTQDRGTDLGVASWPPEAWKIGGGTACGWISYDPELDLIYYGTSSPAPWNADQRRGDNKWTSTLFARRPATGEAVWAFQFNPHDLFNYDGVDENILLDLPIGGRIRKALLHPGRNGYVYVLDRETGEMLSAAPFVPITTTSAIDPKTGRPMEVVSRRPAIGQAVRDVCPSSAGAKNWQPSSFSPRTGLVYIPHNNLCQEEEAVEANYIEGTPFTGANVKMYAGPGGHRGEVTAWDPVAGRAAWKIREKFPVWSGTAVTAGDVVFYGTMDGWFKAVHARTGDPLWQFKVGSGIVGQPISYRGPDGKQYVAILSGVGGWAGSIVSAGLDSRDGTAAFGFVNAMKDLSEATTAGGMLYVFALP